MATDDDVIDVLVVGAGVSGLGTAAFFEAAKRAGHQPKAARCVVVEAAAEPGGYCRTVVRDGFVFDYAGHFFHFQDPSIHAFITARLPTGDDSALVHVERRAKVIDADGVEVSFPYQAAVRELPLDAQRRCLVDLWHAEHHFGEADDAAASFHGWLSSRLGRGLCDRFLVPYNEKLYATDLNTLDASCMGRFFPSVHFNDAMHPASRAWGYNPTFTYPRRGAVTYVDALRRDLDRADLLLSEPATHIDLATKTLTTTKRRLRYRHLVTSAPLPQTLTACGLTATKTIDLDAFRSNRVLVFNLGFDGKGRDDVHWLYVARRDVPFYRVGFYDVITGGDRMSLYVEVGLPAGDGPVDVDGWRARVLQGLRDLGVVTTQQVVAEHHVVMDPAYVHLTPQGLAAAAQATALLRAHDVHAIGRYGAWTYCSIEDNLVSARAIVAALPRLAD